MKEKTLEKREETANLIAQLEESENLIAQLEELLLKKVESRQNDMYYARKAAGELNDLLMEKNDEDAFLKKAVQCLDESCQYLAKCNAESVAAHMGEEAASDDLAESMLLIHTILKLKDFIK